MDTKVIVVGTSLLVVGAFAALGGTLEAFTVPLPIIGVGTLVGFDPLRLKQAAASTAF